MVVTKHTHPDGAKFIIDDFFPEPIPKQDYWFGNKATSDVVVSLIKSFRNFRRNAGSQVDEDVEKDSSLSSNTNKKRKRSTEDVATDSETSGGDHEKHLADVHVHSHQLRHYSNFNTSLSNRQSEISSKRPKLVRFSLNVLSNVSFYEECFARMYSLRFMDIPNVRHCLELVKVSVQIGYQTLTDACLSYLATVPWSQDDENRIRKFAMAPYYPSNCARELNARLVRVPMGRTEMHEYVVGLTEGVLKSYFDSAIADPKNILDRRQCVSTQDMFESAFRQILAGPCQSVVESVVKYVNESVKRRICERLDPYLFDMDGFYKIRWVLKVLLESRCAKEMVEYIVEESKLEESVRGDDSGEREWFESMLLVLKAMNSGHLLVKASTRLKLLLKWIWIFARFENEWNKTEVRKELSAYITTFPYEQQKEIFSIWLKNAPLNMNSAGKDSNFKHLHEEWIVYLQERIMSLEPQQSIPLQSCPNVGQGSGTPTLSNTGNPHSSPRLAPTSPR